MRVSKNIQGQQGSFATPSRSALAQSILASTNQTARNIHLVGKKTTKKNLTCFRIKNIQTPSTATESSAFQTPLRSLPKPFRKPSHNSL
jgi:hypothetical protein